MALRPYQLQGVDFLLKREAALLADEMGLGKTIQAIAAVLALTANVGFIRTLVIAPSSLQTNWADELARWAPDFPRMPIIGDQEDRLASYLLPIAIQVSSYEQIRADAAKMRGDNIYDLIILDEAQRIKNEASLTALACRLVPRHRAWALTGTPMENKPEDLTGIFRFLRLPLPTPSISGRIPISQIEPFVLRRRLRDVAPELPPVLDRTIRLDLTEPQELSYAAARRSAQSLAQERDSRGSSLLAEITKLKQICNFDKGSGASAKLNTLLELLAECLDNGKKVILFSQYVETLTWLMARLPYDSLLFHGGLSSEERDQVIDNFRLPDSRLLLMSLKAGGVGLNLQFASVVVLFDRWWNPATENQAISRVLRIGQAEPVLVYRFISVATIEESIERLLIQKEKMFDENIDVLADGTQSSDLRSLILTA